MKKTKLLSIVTLLAILVCAIMSLTLTACGSKVEITLSQTEISVVEGKKASVTATVKGSDDAVEWAIEDKTVADIAVIGKMCSVSGKKIGTTKLTAKVGDKSAECTVKVIADNTEKVTITLDGSEVTETSVDVGASKTLVATASNGSTITWETSQAKVVTVEGGVITGVNKGTATVTAKVTESIKASVTVTVTGEGNEYVDLESTGAAGATDNPGKWTYWAESWVNVEEAYSIGNDVTITFSNNDSDSVTFFYATQMFYKNADLTSDHIYKLTFDCDSPAMGRITLNGNIITLEEGKHSYTTYYTEGATSVSIQLGVNGVGMEIKEGTLSLSNLAWVEDSTTEKLAAPSFTYNSETGVITITDTTNVKGSVGKYTLNFYDDNDEVKGNTTVVSGTAVDVSTIPNGTWTAKLVAVGANIHYTNSDPSENSVQITVEKDKTLITNGEEHDAYVNPGAWYEWHDLGYNGSNVTVSDAYIDSNGAIHYSFTISGKNKFNEAAHLYYHYSNLTPETLYVLTMKINATAACTIDICGVKTEIKAEDNTISVPFVHPAENPDWEGKTKGATIRMYFNDDNTYVISDVKVEEAQPTQLVAPSFTIAENVITITDSNEAGVGKYELGFFKGEETTPTATVVVENDKEIDLSQVPADTYTVKLRAVGESALYLTSDWSETTAEVTSNNQNTPIGFNEEKTMTEGWAYWDTKSCGGGADWNNYTLGHCTECYEDGDGNVIVKCEFTLPEKDAINWGVQLFYKDGTNAEGYDVSFTITSTVDTTITACGQSITLEAGVAKTVTATNYAHQPMDGGQPSGTRSAIDIQFGTTSGTFTISYSVEVHSENAEEQA